MRYPSLRPPTEEPTPPVISESAKLPLEKVVEARLVRKIKEIGGASWKFVSVNNRGVSDRIVLFEGHTIFVEAKRTGGKLTALQESFAARVRCGGGTYSVVEGFRGVNGFVDALQTKPMQIEGWYK